MPSATDEIIARIDAEIARLQTAREVLIGLAPTVPPPTPFTPAKKTEPTVSTTDTKTLLSSLQARIDNLSRLERSRCMPPGFYVYDPFSNEEEWGVRVVHRGDNVNIDMPNSPAIRQVVAPFFS